MARRLSIVWRSASARSRSISAFTAADSRSTVAMSSSIEETSLLVLVVEANRGALMVWIMVAPEGPVVVVGSADERDKCSPRANPRHAASISRPTRRSA